MQKINITTRRAPLVSDRELYIAMRDAIILIAILAVTVSFMCLAYSGGGYHVAS